MLKVEKVFYDPKPTRSSPLADTSSERDFSSSDGFDSDDEGGSDEAGINTRHHCVYKLCL